MKKFILFSILIACFSRAYAQEKSFQFGFYGGLNYSYFTNVQDPGLFIDALEQEALFGVHLGGFAQKKINPYFSANVILGASQKGIKKSPWFVGFQNTYLDLATHARFDYKRLFMEIGPEIGYLASTKLILDGKRSKSTFDTFDYKFDFLANVGIGVWITKTTSLSFRASKGFLNTMDVNLRGNNGLPAGIAKGYKNQTYQVSVCQMIF